MRFARKHAFYVSGHFEEIFERRKHGAVVVFYVDECENALRAFGNGYFATFAAVLRQDYLVPVSYRVVRFVERVPYAYLFCCERSVYGKIRHRRVVFYRKRQNGAVFKTGRFCVEIIDEIKLSRQRILREKKTRVGTNRAVNAVVIDKRKGAFDPVDTCQRVVGAADEKDGAFHITRVSLARAAREPPFAFVGHLDIVRFSVKSETVGIFAPTCVVYRYRGVHAFVHRGGLPHHIRAFAHSRQNYLAIFRQGLYKGYHSARDGSPQVLAAAFRVGFCDAVMTFAFGDLSVLHAFGVTGTLCGVRVVCAVVELNETETAVGKTVYEIDGGRIAHAVFDIHQYFHIS